MFFSIERVLDDLSCLVAHRRTTDAMNFVQITAGVDVGIKKVQLSISGVLAKAYLYVDLDNIARIVDRVVLTLDRNPQIITQVLKTVDTTVNAALPRKGMAPQ